MATDSLAAVWRKCWQFVWGGVFKFCCVTGLWGQFWRPFYWFLAFLYHNGVAPLRFMNYGFAPLTSEDELALEPVAEAISQEKESEQTNIRLYERVLSLCPEYPDLESRELVEISCGHGGGVEWIEKTHPKLAAVKGLDRTIVDDLGGKIIQGDAVQNPLPNESVDIVLNVESSHCYVDQPAHFKHCYRILRPGGYLLWADLRPAGELMDLCVSDPKAEGFVMVNQLDITDNVLRSLDGQHKVISPMFNKTWYTRALSLLWKMFWGVPGTAVYRDLTERRFLYHAICWQKPGELKDRDSVCAKG